MFLEYENPPIVIMENQAVNAVVGRIKSLENTTARWIRVCMTDGVPYHRLGLLMARENEFTQLIDRKYYYDMKDFIERVERQMRDLRMPDANAAEGDQADPAEYRADKSVCEHNITPEEDSTSQNNSNVEHIHRYANTGNGAGAHAIHEMADVVLPQDMDTSYGGFMDSQPFVDHGAHLVVYIHKKLTELGMAAEVRRAFILSLIHCDGMGILSWSVGVLQLPRDDIEYYMQGYAETQMRL